MNNSDNFACQTPKTPEKRLKKSARCPIPQDGTQQKTEKIPKPKITPADSEHQIQPAPAKSRKKEDIAERCKPGTKGPQKAIPDSKNSPNYTSGSKPMEGNSRNRHPNSLRHPAGRGSS